MIMRIKSSLFISLCLILLTMSITAQDKQLSLHDLIPGGKTYSRFVPRDLKQLQWCGDEYLYVKGDSVLGAKPGKKEEVLFSLERLNGALTAANLQTVGSLPSFSVPYERGSVLAFTSKQHRIHYDYKKNKVMVSFPWQANEESFDPEAAVSELGETAKLVFRKGKEEKGEQVLTGNDVKKAEVRQTQDETTGNIKYVVSLTLNNSGKKAFADATTELAGKGSISIWMDDKCISAPSVNSAITDGECVIEGNFTYDSAKALADKINAGSIPFDLKTTSTNIISPTLGEGAKNAMVIAGLIAFIVIAAYIIVIYKLPGFVASIALIGQVIGSIACITGFFGNIDSFTLTIPGIAGIILSIGMGVDANVITAERIKEELNNGKTLNGAIELGYKRAWSAVFDGNITVVFVAIILMGAFGPTDSVFGTLLSPVFSVFGASTAGTIYSLGYTLLVGILLNFVFGIFCSRLMLSSLSKFKCFKKRKLYGGAEINE